MDQVGIGGNPCGDLARAKFVEKADILTQDSSQILLANLLGDVLAGINEANGAVQVSFCSKPGEGGRSYLIYMVMNSPMAR